MLARGGDLPSPDRQQVIEKLTPLLKRTGDVVKGKAVFKNQCAKCHVHSGEGTTIGPDLTGMAAHPREELLIHIMDPSRSVEGNYRIYTVTTLEGKVYTGMLASETRTTIELIDAEAKRFTLQRDTLEQISGSSKSLMPEGFEKQLKEEEIVDLLEFLTQKGKYLPLPLEKVATVVSTRGMFYSKDSNAERLIFTDWKQKEFKGVPFVLVDPRGDKVNNVILLHGPQGTIPPTMPRSVSLPCNTAARTIHLLSGVSGWGHPASKAGSVSMIVRLHYKDGKTEDHELKNGEHFADYIRRVDVPGSTFAFALRGQQIRYLTIHPKRAEVVTRIDLVKGRDSTAPVVMAVTVETR
jgi:putative heme-binding domain-containing protein